MPTLKLTQPAVERLKQPAAGRVEYWDSQLPGFGLRISAPRPGRQGGRRTWQAMYRVNGRLIRETIGTTALIPGVAEARELARQSLRKAQQGLDPAEERRRAEVAAAREAEAAAARARDTVGAAIDRYLAERPTVNRQGRPLSSEYLIETGRTLTRDVKPVLGDRPLAELAGDDIRRLVRGIAKDRPSQANHVLAYLSVLFAWAVDEGLTAKNPAAGIKAPAAKVERERALDDAEIKTFWLACEDIGWPFGPLAQLLLLTAQRRDELACSIWAEFDLGKQTWTLPTERAKNGRAHIIHLPRLAIEILENLPRHISRKGWVFSTGLGGSDTPISGFGRGRERISAAMAAQTGSVEHFTLHDLRRSAATGMAALGIAPHVIDKILNHSGGRISGMAKIYNRFEYLPEREAALDLWASHIEHLVNPPAGNVVPFVAAR